MAVLDDICMGRSASRVDEAELREVQERERGWRRNDQKERNQKKNDEKSKKKLPRGRIELPTSGLQAQMRSQVCDQRMRPTS
jgi:hypothetical protein